MNWIWLYCLAILVQSSPLYHVLLIIIATSIITIAFYLTTSTPYQIVINQKTTLHFLPSILKIRPLSETERVLPPVASLSYYTTSSSVHKLWNLKALRPHLGAFHAVQLRIMVCLLKTACKKEMLIQT